jgi:hypothetical protein
MVCPFGFALCSYKTRTLVPVSCHSLTQVCLGVLGSFSLSLSLKGSMNDKYFTKDFEGDD